MWAAELFAHAAAVVLEVDDRLVKLYICVHLVAETVVDDLQHHGIVASVVCIDIDGSVGP